MPVKKISILGATGSVGQSTAQVILAQPELFDIQAVTANSNAELLAQQAIKLKAKQAVVADSSAYQILKESLSGTGIEASCGRQALLEAASAPCDLVMAAIVGFAGLEPIMKAIGSGANVALANKEPLVAAGALVMEAAKKNGCHILPVDSEHNAIFQVFDEGQRRGIERLILTASGGPFRTWTTEQMATATLEQAVTHPNWAMGHKISVDSATLMNKALEVIEAHYLFNMDADKIDVVIHPQSIIHSMVAYEDGSILAQMGAPDMQTPIAYCLGWPDRIRTPGLKLDLKKLIKLDLEPVDTEKFPAIGLAYSCLEKGAAACVAFNAANEVAVEAFLERKTGFTDIVETVRKVFDTIEFVPLETLDDIVSFDGAVRTLAKSYMNNDQHRKKVYLA